MKCNHDQRWIATLKFPVHAMYSIASSVPPYLDPYHRVKGLSCKSCPVLPPCLFLPATMIAQVSLRVAALLAMLLGWLPSSVATSEQTCLLHLH